MENKKYITFKEIESIISEFELHGVSKSNLLVLYSNSKSITYEQVRNNISILLDALISCDLTLEETYAFLGKNNRLLIDYTNELYYKFAILNAVNLLDKVLFSNPYKLLTGYVTLSSQRLYSLVSYFKNRGYKITVANLFTREYSDNVFENLSKVYYFSEFVKGILKENYDNFIKKEKENKKLSLN